MKICTYIKSGYRFDHSAVVFELRLNTFKIGRDVWKFNNNLDDLYDKTYVDKVKNQIQMVKNSMEIVPWRLIVNLMTLSFWKYFSLKFVELPYSTSLSKKRAQ